MDMNFASTSQTKDVFETLLKEALNSKSQKNALNETARQSESFSSSIEDINKSSSSLANPSTEVVKVDVHDLEQGGNFILNKFLNDQEDDDANEVVFIKPPVPKPRKNRKEAVPASSDSSSNNTFKITSPKVIKKLDRENELLSKTNSHSSLNTNASKNSSDVAKNETPGKPHDANDQINFENEIKSKNKNKEDPPKSFRKIVETVLEDQHQKTKYTYERIISITIHKTDRLELASLVIHPVVKIHLVDMQSGEYLKKSDKNRPAVFYYENKDILYITPVISEPFNLYDKRSLYPAWEETVVINEDINLLLHKDNQAIIFFEVMDFVSFAVANSQFNQKGSSRGWHKIAWAFLKPLGKNGASNVDARARLQLYQPGKFKKVSPHICDIFHWWHDKKLPKYPSTIYVTIKGIIPPDKVTETLRSKTPIHGEKASRAALDMNTANNPVKPALSVKSGISATTTNDESAPMWSRSAYQICKLPNYCVAHLESFEEGCLCMKFSNSGLYLACAVLIGAIHSVVIYSVLSYEEICRYSGHQGLIYDVIWSKDDRLILTASADCTVCVWNFKSKRFIEMLPHPSYVYASAIGSQSLIVTGSYDQIIRVWDFNKLMQELEGHNGYVTSLCFNSKSTLLFSADSTGVILQWKNNGKEKLWRLKREIKVMDLRDTLVDQILLHKRERRLLVHARDSALRLVDVKTSCVLYWLQGAVNNRFKTTCSFSPCYNFVLAGGEDGLINVWNSDTGQRLATYTPYGVLNNHQSTPIHCVQYHPHDNIIAVSHYGHDLPILLIMHDGSLRNRSNVGFKIFESNVMKEEETSSRSRSQSAETFRVKESPVIVSKSDVCKEKQGKIRFEDVLHKIDQIVCKNPVSDSCSSVKS